MSRRAAALLLALAVSPASLSCRSAASVLLDIPETPETEKPAPTAKAEATRTTAPTAELDTVRLEIEALADEDSVISLLPRASDGTVDWVAALRQGVIRPRDSVTPAAQQRQKLFGYDFYLGGFEAYFPHSAHVQWVDCASCHPGIFRTRGSSTSMKQINEGESCGRCHGKVAFSVNACERCHSSLSMQEGRLEPSLGPTSVVARANAAADSVTNQHFPPSIFPHGVHRLRYTCAACHPDLFAMAPSEPGAIKMTAIQAGEACGTCHNGRAAFGVLECAKCHREPSRTEESG